MKADSNFVSLVIPTIGRETLALTKAAIKSQTRPPDELIVIIDKYRRGPCWARNEGIAKAKGDLIAFIDDDCVPGKDWLERMIVAMDKYDAAMVSSHYTETDPFLNEIRRRRKFPVSTQINPAGFVGTGGNIIYRRASLAECFMDDGFVFNQIFGHYACEDTDLSFRLKKRGHKLVFIDNRITHLKKMSPLKFLKFQFYRGVGIGILYRIHKHSDFGEVPDKSLLWKNETNSFHIMKWIRILYKKIIGPFDVNSFSSVKYFITFWIGEKIQSLGFLYAWCKKFKYPE